MGRNRHPRYQVARFSVFAALLVVAFFAVSSSDVYRVRVGVPYLEWTARTSGSLLKLVGVKVVSTHGHLLFAGAGSINVDRGCDASSACALFAALTLAFPAGGVRKFVAAGAGVALLIALNLVRVASLALAQARTPELFEFLHVDFWQAVFVLFAIALWAAWFPYALRGARPDSGVAA